MLTEEKEDYLKAILTNDGDVSFVSNKKLSQFLNIKPPSVSEMVGRLEKEGYVETKHYKGARLTRRVKANVRHHKTTSITRIIFNRNFTI